MYQGVIFTKKLNFWVKTYLMSPTSSSMHFCQIAIQRCPVVCLVCPSVKQARFVAMGAIDLLLCEEVPLGQVT
jgi:hypothetical protein